MSYMYDWIPFKLETWSQIKATRDAYLADPTTPVPDWWICHTYYIPALSSRLNYVVYDQAKPGKALTYGYHSTVDESLHFSIIVALDKHHFPRSGREWFKTPTGQLRGLPLSTALELIRDYNERNRQAVKE